MTTQAPAKPRPAVVAAAVLMVGLVCGTGSVGLLSEMVTGTVERSDSFTTATDRLVVDADGDVTIGPSDDGRVHVRTIVGHGLDEPEIVQESTPSGVRLTARCRGFLAVRCDVTHEVAVPPAFEVVVDGADGDVTASGLSGPLTVDRSHGDITVTEVAGPLDLRSNTGEIIAEAVRAPVVRAATDVGDVRLELLVVPQSADLVSETGEVDLAVPDGTAYRVDAATDNGEERVLVPTDPGSPHALRAISHIGDVTVRPSR
ncbi:MAG TPA: DUF4097 family beta strand repeat-containing protein [Pseudonocardia sp.]|jgi:hypothetical protein|uniref:DUF4097 family beta strand repeat-containing protein n=1 Tax=Pseudonocardia sp. TaxID=60912 RepID=UPI002B4B7768|nr:DUF4097 family beta strand repeat-containing protein [Pseudonocardia sp.]HLU59503.1 DUF4097 family beta strand repeat-containing protein [Pseudonocardia sp.]